MYTGNVQVVILVSCEGFGEDVKEGVRLGERAGQSGGIGRSVTLEAMETKEQLRFRFAVIRATAKIRHNRGEVLSGSTRSEEESGGGGGGAIEEVVPLVDVVYGCVIAGLGMFDERAEIIVIFQSLDKTSI